MVQNLENFFEQSPLMNPSSSSAKFHSWKISMQAKSKLFNLKLNASNLFPNLGTGGEKISFSLRLRRFLFLKVKSENRNHSAPRSRLYRFVGKFLQRKRRQIDPLRRNEHQNQGPMAAFIGTSSLLSHSTDEKNQRIIAHALFLFFYLIFLIKRKKTNLPLLLVAITVSFVGFSLSCLSYTCTDLTTNVIWKTWNNIVSIGCLLALSQVIFSKNTVIIQRNQNARFIILAFISFFLHKLSREMFFRLIKCAIEGAPILTSVLLLPYQAFFYTLGDLKDPGVLGLYVSSTYFWGKKLIKFMAYSAGTILS